MSGDIEVCFYVHILVWYYFDMWQDKPSPPPPSFYTCFTFGRRLPMMVFIFNARKSSSKASLRSAAAVLLTFVFLFWVKNVSMNTVQVVHPLSLCSLIQEKQQRHFGMSDTKLSVKNRSVVSVWHRGSGVVIRALTSEVAGQCLASAKWNCFLDFSQGERRHN